MKEKMKHIGHVLVNGDISMLLLLAGLGLILWATFGVVMFTNDLNAYAKMFPFGNGIFWVLNYALCGLAMWYLVGAKLPAVPSLLVGAWVCMIWSWSATARFAEATAHQTSNATSIVYILIGLMLIQRTGNQD